MTKHKHKKSKPLRDLVIDRDLPFTLMVRVRGRLGSNYVFQNTTQLEHWKTTFFPALQKEYGSNLTYTTDTLCGFKIGDICGIHGDGWDEYRIKSIIKYSEYRYGYVLDSGCAEEIAKSFDVLAIKRAYDSDMAP